MAENVQPSTCVYILPFAEWKGTDEALLPALLQIAPLYSSCAKYSVHLARVVGSFVLQHF